MAKQRQNIRRRQRKKKVSALDIYEEFENESSNSSVEVNSKLSAAEQQKIKENYDSATKVLTAKNSPERVSTAPSDQNMVSPATSMDEISMSEEGSETAYEKPLIGYKSVINTQSMRNQNSPNTESKERNQDVRLRNQSVINNRDLSSNETSDYVIKNSPGKNPSTSDYNNLASDYVINTQSKLNILNSDKIRLRNQYVIKSGPNESTNSGLTEFDYVINTQSKRNQNHISKSRPLAAKSDSLNKDPQILHQPQLDQSTAPEPKPELDQLNTISAENAATASTKQPNKPSANKKIINGTQNEQRQPLSTTAKDCVTNPRTESNSINRGDVPPTNNATNNATISTTNTNTTTTTNTNTTENAKTLVCPEKQTKLMQRTSPVSPPLDHLFKPEQVAAATCSSDQTDILRESASNRPLHKPGRVAEEDTNFTAFLTSPSVPNNPCPAPSKSPSQRVTSPPGQQQSQLDINGAEAPPVNSHATAYRPNNETNCPEIQDSKETVKAAHIHSPESLKAALTAPVTQTKSPEKSQQTTVEERNQSVIKAQSERNQYVIKAQSERNQNLHNTQSHAQSRTQSERNQNFDYFALAPMEEKILMYLFELCVKMASKKTPQIRYQQIAQAITTTEKTAKNTCQRLIRKGALVREQYSKGPGSKTSFSIPQQAYEQIYFFIKPKDNSFNQVNTDSRLRNQYVINAQSHAQSHAQSNLPSKLDRELNLSKLPKEQTDQEEDAARPYDEVDLEPLKSAGITRKQLRDIHNQKLTLSSLQLQDLVDKFAEYYAENRTKIHRPAGLFVKMAQQLAGGDDPLPHLESGAEIDLQRIKKQLLAKKTQREKEIREVQGLLFENWWTESTQAEKESLVPKHLTNVPKFYRSAVYQKWSESIWPETPEGKGLKIERS